MKTYKSLAPAAKQLENNYTTTKKLFSKKNTPEEALKIMLSGAEGLPLQQYAELLLEQAGSQEYALLYIELPKPNPKPNHEPQKIYPWGRWLLVELNKEIITGSSSCLTSDKKLLKNIKNLTKKGYDVPTIVIRLSDSARVAAMSDNLHEKGTIDLDLRLIPIAKETLLLNPPKPCMKSITFFMADQAISFGIMGYEKGPYFSIQTNVAILPPESKCIHTGKWRPDSIDLSFDDITRIKTRNETYSAAHTAINNGASQSLIQRTGLSTDTILRLFLIELENRPGPYSNVFFIDHIKSGKRIGFIIGDTPQTHDEQGYPDINISDMPEGRDYPINHYDYEEAVVEVDWDFQILNSLGFLFPRLYEFGPTQVAGDIPNSATHQMTVP